MVRQVGILYCRAVGPGSNLDGVAGFYWWKAVNCGTSHIDSSEAVVYGIPLGLLGFAS